MDIYFGPVSGIDTGFSSMSPASVAYQHLDFEMHDKLASIHRYLSSHLLMFFGGVIFQELSEAGKFFSKKTCHCFLYTLKYY